MPQKGFAIRDYAIIAAVLAGVVFFVYILHAFDLHSSSLRGDFTTLDDGEILINPSGKLEYSNEVAGPRRGETGDSGHKALDGPFIPLTDLTLGLSARGENIRAWRFHLFSILIHYANTVLVALIAGILLRSPLFGGFCGLLFAVHPAAGAAAMWISGRKYLVGTFFSLAAVLSFMRFFSPVGVKRRWGAYAAAILFSAAAMLSWEGTIWLPLFWCVYHFSFKAKGIDARERIKKVASKFAYYVTPIALVIAGSALQLYGTRRSFESDAGEFGYLAGVKGFFAGIGHTFSEIIFPVFIRPYYDIAPGAGSSTKQAVTGALITGLFILVGVISAFRGRKFLALAAFAFLAIAPAAGLFLPTDRFAGAGLAYLPVAVFSVALGAVSAYFWELLTGRTSRGVNIALAGGVAVFFAVVTLVYAPTFSDTESLWKRVRDYQKGSPVANMRLGEYYEMRGAESLAAASGFFEDAIEHYGYIPLHGIDRRFYGECLVRLGGLQLKMTRAAPDGRIEGIAQARDSLGKAVDFLKRSDRAGHRKLAAEAQIFYAETFIKERKWTRADAAYDTAIELAANIPESSDRKGIEIAARLKKGTAYRAQLKYDEAVMQFEKILELEKDYLPAVVELAASLRDTGEYARALELLEKQRGKEGISGRIRATILTEIGIIWSARAIDRETDPDKVAEYNQTAEGYLNEAIALAPASFEIRKSMAAFYNGLGRYDEAEGILEEGRQVPEIRADCEDLLMQYLVELAGLTFQELRPVEVPFTREEIAEKRKLVERSLEKALELNPRAWEPRLILADYNQRMGRYLKAVEDYEVLVSDHPKSKFFSFKLALGYKEYSVFQWKQGTSKTFQEAGKYFELCRARLPVEAPEGIDPEEYEGLKDFVWRMQDTIPHFVVKANVREAITDARRIVNSAVRDGAGEEAFISALNLLNRTAGEDAARDNVLVSSTIGWIYDRLAFATGDDEHLKSALAFYRNAKEKAPGEVYPDPVYLTAQALFRLGQRRPATELYIEYFNLTQRTGRFTRQSYDALYEIARFYDVLADKERNSSLSDDYNGLAFDIYSVIHNYPAYISDKYEFYYFYGHKFYSKGDIRKAREYFDRFVLSAGLPDDATEEAREEYAGWLADAELLFENISNNIEIAEEALAAAREHLEGDRLDEAFSELLIARDIIPFDYTVKVLIGHAWRKKGDAEMAITFYQGAIRSDPGRRDMPEIFFYLGKLLFETGDISGAGAHLATYQKITRETGEFSEEAKATLEEIKNLKD